MDGIAGAFAEHVFQVVYPPRMSRYVARMIGCGMIHRWPVCGRAALVTSEKSNSVKLKLSNNLLEITASSPDFGDAHESMAIEYAGPELQVAFNPQFVMDPLRALNKDQVFFELKDEVSPGVFKTLESFVCVIMPVRLS